MSNLTDHIDRLTQISNSIRENASISGRTDHLAGSSAGPFTRAVLNTPLGDLIRDIDPSELGLFTLVQPSQHPTFAAITDENQAAQKAEIARVALPIATPLRRPPTTYRREDGQKPGEHEPEVYAHAALKYLDRYQSIRPMPRYLDQAEHILEQLNTVRENIAQLNQQISQKHAADPSGLQLSPKARAQEEERRIAQAHARISELKRQKEMLLQKSKQGSAKLRPPERRRAEPQTPQAPDDQESEFWNTPGAAPRTLHFTGELLTDEQLDMADLSGSLASPVPEVRRRPPGSSRALQFQAPEADASVQDELAAEEQSPPESPEPPDVADEDKTVRASASFAEPEPEPPHPEPEPESKPAQPSAPAPSRSGKTKVTTELEHIVSKIWATIGDLIMPGHHFDVTGSSAAKPPRAKETIAHLQSLAAQSPALNSPSATSLSSLSAAAVNTQPTTQQILTAHMLLALLSSPPDYSRPLNSLKEVISKAEGGTLGGVTKPIYACVAKRLLKIDRGGGEQVVRFTV